MSNKPIFKVGDTVRRKNESLFPGLEGYVNAIYNITAVYESGYICVKELYFCHGEPVTLKAKDFELVANFNSLPSATITPRLFRKDDYVQFICDFQLCTKGSVYQVVSDQLTHNEKVVLNLIDLKRWGYISPYYLRLVESPNTLYAVPDKTEVNLSELPKSIVDYEQTISQCFHTWKVYFGLNDRFEYCTKCDEKKND